MVLETLPGNTGLYFLLPHRHSGKQITLIKLLHFVYPKVILMMLNFVSDEEIALDTSELESMESSLPEVLRDMWEGQFVPVGQHLLQRVKSHHTDLVPLESPS